MRRVTASRGVATIACSCASESEFRWRPKSPLKRTAKARLFPARRASFRVCGVKGRARLFIAIGVAVVAFGTIMAILVTLFVVRPWIRRRAVEEARERGIELTFQDMSFGIGWVRLTDASFRLVDVTSLSGRARRILVELDRLEPKRIEAQGMDLEVEGSVALVALEIGEWTKNYPKTYRLPFEASEVGAAWRPKKGAPDWLKLEQGSVRPRPGGGGGSLRAEKAIVAGFALGKVGTDWSSDDAIVALGFGTEDLSKAPVRARVEHALERPKATITLAPIDLKELGGPFGVSLPVENVIGSGEAVMLFQRGEGEHPVDGALSARLKGYIPPHPPEIDGFVFGDTTTLDTRFRVDESHTRADLIDTRVSAGAFKLAGNGAITRHPDHGQIQMLLRGSLPCGSLANAAAETRLGKVIGSWVGAAAKYFLRGSVAVTVKIDADTRDLPKARVERAIGVGCGLRPIPELSDLGIDLSKLPLPTSFPPLPSSFPPIPSNLPPIFFPIPGAQPPAEEKKPSEKPAPEEKKPAPAPAPS